MRIERCGQHLDIARKFVAEANKAGICELYATVTFLIQNLDLPMIVHVFQSKDYTKRVKDTSND